MKLVILFSSFIFSSVLLSTSAFPFTFKNLDFWSKHTEEEVQHNEFPSTLEISENERTQMKQPGKKFLKALKANGQNGVDYHESFSFSYYRSSATCSGFQFDLYPSIPIGKCVEFNSITGVEAIKLKKGTEKDFTVALFKSWKDCKSDTKAKFVAIDFENCIYQLRGGWIIKYSEW